MFLPFLHCLSGVCTDSCTVLGCKWETKKSAQTETYTITANQQCSFRNKELWRGVIWLAVEIKYQPLFPRIGECSFNSLICPRTLSKQDHFSCEVTWQWTPAQSPKVEFRGAGFWRRTQSRVQRSRVLKGSRKQLNGCLFNHSISLSSWLLAALGGAVVSIAAVHCTNCRYGLSRDCVL